MSEPRAPHLDPDAWSRLVAGLEPLRVQVLLRSWMGPKLLAHVAVEDLWQETLLHCWRDRAAHHWRDVAAFRRWVLGVARHRVADTRDRIFAAKRGSGRAAETLADVELPPASTTPSRLVVRMETVRAMESALAELPEEQRGIVRESLLGERPMPEIASELGVSLGAAWYRFRTGIASYAAKLERVLGESRRAPYAAPEDDPSRG
ncbi:MAG: RNA polymerase sigma factor [Planctomycetota bacterium]